MHTHGLPSASEVHRLDIDSTTAGKRGGLSLNVFKIRQRIVGPSSQQLFRVWIRERIQQNRIEHAKDRRVGADPECQCQYSASGKRGRAKQGSSGVMQVLDQRLNKTDTSSLAALILDLIESAELQPDTTHSLGSAHSRFHIFLSLSLEMKTQLVVKFVLCGSVPHQGTQSEE